MLMRQKRTPHADILQMPLLQLTATDTFRVVDLVQNVSCQGQPGSGKTSAMASLARAILLSGASVLAFCVKADEAALWIRYCKETNRDRSVIIFDGKHHRYNFIVALLAQYGFDGINIIIEAIMYVLDIARTMSGGASKADVFWEDIIRLLLRHCLAPIYLAKGTISIASIIAFVRSAPRTSEDMNNSTWQEQSFFFQCFRDAHGKMDEAMLQQMVSFWRDEWMNLNGRTKTNASISLCTTLDRFNHGWLREAFTTDCTMVPELLLHGAVVILDMPALTHMEDGILAQRLMKFLTQRMLLARQSYGPEYAERLVVLWMDEAHQLIDKNDARFMSMSRSALCATVIMAQSLPTYYAVMGGENPRDRVDMLLANCATKLWFSNSCPVSNKAASDTLGQAIHRRANYSLGSSSSTNSGNTMGLGENWSINSGTNWSSNATTSPQGSSFSSGSGSSHGSSEGSNANRGRSTGYGTSSNTSGGWSEQMGYILEPSAFGHMLKTGGPANGNRVTAVLYQAGRNYVASGGPSLLVEFSQ